MAEGVDARSVDVGHRAGRAHLEIAADEADADGIARTQRRGCRRRDRRGMGAGRLRDAAASTSACAQLRVDAGSKPLITMAAPIGRKRRRQIGERRGTEDVRVARQRAQRRDGALGEPVQRAEDFGGVAGHVQRQIARVGRAARTRRPPTSSPRSA